ncbi:MAG: ATP-binding protein [Oscillospiraceae bacterium]|jgi:predicted AAA+ superfamily ATPase|nr:ATP-binding protein [Oscillospiraceae bacterium]
MITINRPEYLDFLIRSKNKQIIKVVSGLRRSGKSTLFDIYRNWLLGNGVLPQQIISINFEELDNEHLTDYKLLYNHIKQFLQLDKMNYIFLDEIQHVDQFEKTVDSLFIKKNVDLYITGSNAYFMSGDLATLLTGRYIELRMLPLSFAEYCEGLSLYIPNNNMNKMEKYAKYIEESSMPYALQLHGQQREIHEYLEGIYNSILMNDILKRLKVSDVMMLESVTKFVFDNIGSLLSSNKIANTMTTFGRKIDQKTVEKYLKGLMDSLMIYQVNRYDIKGKQHLASLEKYYVADVGFRHFLLGKSKANQGHILENIVYLELLRRGNEVYVGHLPNNEVDFVAQNINGITYYQVAATVLDENTMRRELASLERVSDHHPKILLSLDEIGAGTIHNGIRQLNVLDWLLNR